MQAEMRSDYVNANKVQFNKKRTLKILIMIQMPNKTQEQKMDEMTEVGVHPNHDIHDGRLQFQPSEKTIEFICLYLDEEC